AAVGVGLRCIPKAVVLLAQAAGCRPCLSRRGPGAATRRLGLGERPWSAPRSRTCPTPPFYFRTVGDRAAFRDYLAAAFRRGCFWPVLASPGPWLSAPRIWDRGATGATRFSPRSHILGADERPWAGPSQSVLPGTLWLPR